MNQVLVAKTQECDKKTLEINSLEQRIGSLTQDIAGLQALLDNNNRAEGSAEEAEGALDMQSPDQGAGASTAIRLGAVYKCTKTLFRDDPEMVAFIRKRNPGNVDKKYSALQFVKKEQPDHLRKH